METTKTSFDAPETKLHFLDYWRIVRIRKTVILAVFLLVAITVTLVTYILPEQFDSTVRIAVQKDSSDVTSLNGPHYTPGYDPYWIQDQFEKIQSKSMLYPVISNLDLKHKWAKKFKEEELRLDDAYRLLKGQTRVSQSHNTSMIEIRVLDEKKEDAALIANEIAKVYRDTRITLRRELASGGIRALEKQLEEHIQKIGEKQKEVDKKKTELKISDSEATIFGMTSTPEPEILRKLENLRIEAQADYEQIFTLYTHLIKLTRAEFKSAILVVSTDQHLTTLLEQQASTEQKFADLIQIYSAEHPEVIRIRAMSAKINEQVDERLSGIQEGLKAKVESAKAKWQRYQAEVAQVRDVDIKTAIERQPYWDLKKELESMKTVREKLDQHIFQEKVDLKIPTTIVEIMDPAEPGLRPAKPNKVLNIALGVIVGLIMGVGLAFFIEYLDTSVKTIDDVERALQAPVLGVIPQNVGALLDEGPDSPHAEAYRVLRTNVLFSRKDDKFSTVTVVSGGAGEGKSTTLFNLATVFAQNGSRVLVVDSDLRRPSIHKLLRLSNSIGLTNYLLKQNTLEEVIQTTPLPTLDFLPSGKLPSSSMGILSSMQMKELIRELKRRYDFVFFDSPPIMGVSDASVLASEVDMVLQVIQYRRYPQPMTIRAKQMIEKVGGNLLGIVLNNINMAQDENYYYYSGYYYDYYSKTEDDEGKPAGDKKKSATGEEKVELKQKY